VKGNFAGTNAVNLRFRLRDTGKNRQRPFFRARAYGGFLDERPYVAPGIVRAMNVIRAMCVARVIAAVAASAVLMPVIVTFTPRAAVLVLIAGNMTGFPFQFNRRVKAAKPPPFILDKIEFPAVNAEFGKLRTQPVRIDSQIDQRPQYHIARNSGVTIEVQYLHITAVCVRRRGKSRTIPPGKG
jgi:hypothetical protein